jgi:hypothetical protein
MKKELDRINEYFYKGASARGRSPPTWRLIMTKTETTRRLKSEVSQPKSALLRILRTIERDGLRKDADQLSNIIARLEDWQNR